MQFQILWRWLYLWRK